MNTRTEHITKGLLSLAVILMFAAALVADQARANLPASDRAQAENTAGLRSGILLDAATLRKIDTLPSLLGRILSLPVTTDLCIELLRPERDGAQSPDTDTP